MRPLDRVAGMSILKSAGIEAVVKQAGYNHQTSRVFKTFLVFILHLNIV